MPFALITEIGNRIKISSEPFFRGNKIKNTIPINKLVINKTQLRLNVLLIAKVFIDLTNIEMNDTKRILLINQMYLGVL